MRRLAAHAVSFEGGCVGGVCPTAGHTHCLAMGAAALFSGLDARQLFQQFAGSALGSQGDVGGLALGFDVPRLTAARRGG